MPRIDLSEKDCERLGAMLDVHVRPIYWRIGADPEGTDETRRFGAERMADCERLADLFHEAAGSTAEARGLERNPLPEVAG